MEQKWRCPHCGGEMEEKPKFCAFCGVEAPKEKPRETDLMEQAGKHMVGNRFSEARKLLEQALELEPKNGDLWALLLLCKLGKKDIDDLAGAERLLCTYEEFGRAVEYGTEHRKEVYRRLEDQNRKQLLAKKGRLETELTTLKKQIGDRKWELQAMESRRDLPTWKKVLLIIEKIFVIANVAWWTFGTLFVFPLIILDAPFIVWLVFVIKRDKQRKKAVLEYPGLLERQQADQASLAEKWKAYQQWLRETGLEEGEKQ